MTELENIKVVAAAARREPHFLTEPRLRCLSRDRRDATQIQKLPTAWRINRPAAATATPIKTA
jgi:hypothetical protein